MKKIIFVTGNRSKMEQLRFIVRHFKVPLEIISAREVYGESLSYEEIGDTVEEVALNGAKEISTKISMPVITEDTDLRIDALNGEPGIRAGAFLKQFGRQEILKRMEGVFNRRATISSAVAYAQPDGFSKTFVNRVYGQIHTTEKFGNFPAWVSPTDTNPLGGGYNSIFIPERCNVTLAEIKPEEAIHWSYREKNFIDVIQFIMALE